MPSTSRNTTARPLRPIAALLGVLLVSCMVLAPALAATTDQIISSSPRERARAYRHVGLASWYGRESQGRRTATGERFDRHKLTAAHRTLPLHTRLRVTNLSNGRTVEVMVSDRGPFKHRRIIDLSEAAASQLGMHRKGVGWVKIEVMPGAISG
jgi:rare lipoprotein A